MFITCDLLVLHDSFRFIQDLRIFKDLYYIDLHHDHIDASKCFKHTITYCMIVLTKSSNSTL